MPAPVDFDFPALADGLRRNNVGVGGFTLEVRARCEDGSVVLEPSGQRFPLDGEAFDGDGWRRLAVHDWDGEPRLSLAGED